MDERLKAISLIVLLIGGQVLLAAPVPQRREINASSPQLQRLDPKRISEAERRPWHPAELVAIVGDQRGRHWQYLEGVSYSQDGKRIATNSRGHIYLWEVSSFRFHALLPIEASFMRFVSEGNSLLTCGPDGIVRTWKVSEDKPRSRVIARNVPIVRQEIPSEFSHVAVSADGKKLVVATREGYTYYDMSASPPKHCYIPLGEGMWLLQAAFSPDSRNLVTLKGEVIDWRGYLRGAYITKQEVTLWDVSGPTPKAKCTLRGARWWWDRITFSPNGKTVVCGANLWDLSGEKPQFRAAMNGESQDVREDVQDCVFFSGSRYALTAGLNGKESPSHFYVRVRDMRERIPRILQSVQLDDAYYRGMALSPDGKSLAVGEGNCLHLWQMKEEKIQIPPPSHGHTQAVKALSFGACGNLLATIDRDHSLRLWDLDGPQPHQRLVHNRKWGSWDTVALSPDGTKLATGFRDGAFTLWQITPSGLRVLAEYNRGGTVLAFAPDSKTLFSSAGFGMAKVIDVSKPTETAATLDARRPGGHFAIEALAVSPDGNTVALGGGWDIELWQKTDSGWEKRTNFRFRGDVKSLSFGGRGSTLLVGGGSHQKPQVHLFDVQGEKPTWITDFAGLRDAALSVTASSTGQMFAATDQTGRGVVWSSAGKKLHEWTFPGPVRCVSFAPDGRHLALGNGDGTVYILRLGVPANK